MQYNCECWTPSTKQTKWLNTQHRKILRLILNIRYPDKITNKNLYKFFQSPDMMNICNRKTLFTSARIRKLDHNSAFQKVTRECSLTLQYHRWFNRTNSLQDKMIEVNGIDCLQLMSDKAEWAEIVANTFT